MVRDPSLVCLGLGYFYIESDSIWNFLAESKITLAKKELDKIGIIEAAETVDAKVLRMENTYPAYFGIYESFPEIRDYLYLYEHLTPIGRNEMDRYNNPTHSMLTAMVVVDNILSGRTNERHLWEVNTEMDYQEEVRTPETCDVCPSKRVVRKLPTDYRC